MVQRIIECVPNFSEGRDMAKIKQITDAIESTSGVTLLDVDPGADANRTVVTFIGPPETIGDAAFKAIKRASEVIDMSTHRGAHPRMGATDVCPFIPVSGVTMQECIEIAYTVGKRVGEELNIPVYFYEQAAKTEMRQNLAVIRKGEYEGLERKLADPQWIPDCGPKRFNARSGATVIGAREFLIAYNISLNTREIKYATDIAFELRRKGRVARENITGPFYYKGTELFYQQGSFPCGNCQFHGTSMDQLRDHYHSVHSIDFMELCGLHDYEINALVGKKALKAGLFDHCKSIGWYMDAYERAQISINLTNYSITPPQIVLEEARRLATERGIVVTGSEIVGLIPFKALFEAGQYYLKKQGKSHGIPIIDVLKNALQSMGLNDVSHFDISKKVIGLPQFAPKALVSMTVTDFTDEVSRDTPAPGGGSIAALAGSLGAALASMVANLTQGKPGSEPIDELMVDTAFAAQTIKHSLLQAVDEDTQAFNGYMEALRLPKNTPEEKSIRTQKMQEGLKVAVAVPFQTAQQSYEAMLLCQKSALHGNANSITDAAVGAQIAFSGVRGGLWNVTINLKDIKDKEFITDMQNKCATLLKKAETLLKEISDYVDSKLLEMIKQKQK